MCLFRYMPLWLILRWPDFEVWNSGLYDFGLCLIQKWFILLTINNCSATILIQGNQMTNFAIAEKIIFI